ncbi:hypothetical protein AAF712_016699, partial [Marasmius tenuissimus]
RQGCVSGSANVDGAPVVIQDCNNEEQIKHTLNFTWDDWNDVGPQQIKFYGGEKCLDVINGIQSSGTKLQLWTCDATNTNPNQQWIVNQDHTYQWNDTNLCIDITDGNINDGTQLQLWMCDDRNHNQAFLPQRVGNSVVGPVKIVPLLQVDQILFCLTAESNADGAGVSLSWCSDDPPSNGKGNLTWYYPNPPLGGPIYTFDGAKCLDVPNGNDVNGQQLQIWSCDPSGQNPNQQWRLDEHLHSLTWIGKNKCVDLTDGKAGVGTALQIWDCAGDLSNRNQWWFLNAINETVA